MRNSIKMGVIYNFVQNVLFLRVNTKLVKQLLLMFPRNKDLVNIKLTII